MKNIIAFLFIVIIYKYGYSQDNYNCLSFDYSYEVTDTNFESTITISPCIKNIKISELEFIYYFNDNIINLSNKPTIKLNYNTSILTADIKEMESNRIVFCFENKEKIKKWSKLLIDFNFNLDNKYIKFKHFLSKDLMFFCDLKNISTNKTIISKEMEINTTELSLNENNISISDLDFFMINTRDIKLHQIKEINVINPSKKEVNTMPEVHNNYLRFDFKNQTKGEFKINLIYSKTKTLTYTYIHP
ncbi:MAG: hypothetical protein N4A49_14780 [Marinifilaceae bacterium]|jgi:hypothetical protein|nr:hypothetical protein [Marinifilaceae bacterium]